MVTTVLYVDGRPAEVWMGGAPWVSIEEGVLNIIDANCGIISEDIPLEDIKLVTFDPLTETQFVGLVQ